MRPLVAAHAALARDRADPDRAGPHPQVEAAGLSTCTEPELPGDADVAERTLEGDPARSGAEDHVAALGAGHLDRCEPPSIRYAPSDSTRTLRAADLDLRPRAGAHHDRSAAGRDRKARGRRLSGASIVGSVNPARAGRMVTSVTAGYLLGTAAPSMGVAPHCNACDRRPPSPKSPSRERRSSSRLAPSSSSRPPARCAARTRSGSGSTRTSRASSCTSASARAARRSTPNPRMTVDSLRTLYDSEEFFEGREENLNYYSFLSGESTCAGRPRAHRPLPAARAGHHAARGRLGRGLLPGRGQGGGIRRRGRRVLRPDGPLRLASAGACRSPPARSRRPTSTTETYDVIASWGVMTIIRDPKAVMAKFHAALKPGGVWAFNTYDNRSLWGRLFGAALVHPRAQHEPDPRRPDAAPALDEAGFDLVARRRDRPYASVERLLFVLLSHLIHGVRDTFFERVHFLNRSSSRCGRPTRSNTSA